MVSVFKEPIRSIYRSLSPHPLFRDLDFEFGRFSDAGELYFKVSHDGVSVNPSTTFSMAQSNILALAVFLALNSEQEWSTLAVTLIDDPIQHMDDVNVLSLIDILRQKSELHQVVLSTSSLNLYRLM